MSELASLQLFLLAALFFALVASLAASVGFPLVRRLVVSSPPHARFRALLLLAVSPAIGTAVGMSATVAPSVLGLVWPTHDHCLVHGGSHAHLCFVHLPGQVGGPVSWVVLLAAFVFLCARAASGIAALVRARRVCSQLLAHGAHDPRLAASVLPTPSPLCLSVGLFEPKTVLSEGFLRAIGGQQLEAVLVHERAHATRRDALLMAVARAATVLTLPGARNALLGELELAAEQSCDEAAARAIGDRLTMAETILRVERLIVAAHPARPLAVSFGGTGIPARVAALVGPPLVERRGYLPAVLVALAFVAVGAASDEVHHLTETIVGVLVH